MVGEEEAPRLVVVEHDLVIGTRVVVVAEILLGRLQTLLQQHPLPPLLLPSQGKNLAFLLQ
jgi:hypothetical protein